MSDTDDIWVPHTCSQCSELMDDLWGRNLCVHCGHEVPWPKPIRTFLQYVFRWWCSIALHKRPLVDLGNDFVICGRCGSIWRDAWWYLPEPWPRRLRDDDE